MFFELSILIFVAQITSSKDIVSTEKKDGAQHEKDKSLRRIIDEVDDKEWHIIHLKDTDFFRRSGCADSTLEDKYEKYRKSLKNDGALVEYVYADPLPFNESDLLKTDKCPAPNITELFSYEPFKTTNKHILDKPEKTPITDPTNSATTVKDGLLEAKAIEAKNGSNMDIKRRASEYQYSSIEYYDEVTDFDDEMCPDVVQTIILEVDQIRKYDVECETIIQWRSLDK